MFSFLDKQEVLHEKKTAVVGALSRPLLVNGIDRYYWRNLAVEKFSGKGLRERAGRLSRGGPRKLRNGQVYPGYSTLFNYEIFDWSKPKYSIFENLEGIFWELGYFDARTITWSKPKYQVLNFAPKFSICWDIWLVKVWELSEWPVSSRKLDWELVVDR